MTKILNKETLIFMQKILKLDQLMGKLEEDESLQNKHGTDLKMQSTNIKNLFLELEGLDTTNITMLYVNELINKCREKANYLLIKFGEKGIPYDESKILHKNNEPTKNKKLPLNDKIVKEIDEKLEEMSRLRIKIGEMSSKLFDLLDEQKEVEQEEDRERKILLAENKQEIANCKNKIAIIDQLEDIILSGDESKKKYVIDQLRKLGIDTRELESLDDNLPKLNVRGKNKQFH